MTSQTSLLENLLHKNVPILIGAALGIVGFSLHESFSNQSVMGRWSPKFAVLLGLCWLAWLILVAVMLARNPENSEPSEAQRLKGRALNLAGILWGAGYLLNSLMDPARAGRIFEANIIGSRVPLVAIIENLVLVSLLVWVGVKVYEGRKSRWINLAVAATTVLSILVVGETAARMKSVILPAPQGYPTYSSRMWRRRFVDRNELGFRDSHHDIEKTKPRLLVVGDSYAFGWGLKDPADRFGEVLTAGVAEATGEPWESMNASAGDRNTIQEIAYLEGLVEYSPDIVVLLYYFNDMNYIFPETGSGVVELRRFHPLVVAFENSFLFQELYVRGRALFRGLRGEDMTRLNASSPYADSAAVQRHLADISRFVEVGREAGALVAVVPFDYGAGEGGPTADRYSEFVRAGLEFGLPFIPIQAPWHEYDLKELAVNRLDVHPNELAHRLAAEDVVQRLVQRFEAAANDSTAN